MTVIDRKCAPDFKTIEEITVQQAKASRLDNGVPVYTVNAGVQDLVKIELLFSAGMWQQPLALVASTCNAMMNEGTKNYTSAELAEKIDYYGAFLETGIDQDFASVSLYTLNKYLDQTLPFLEEIIKNSVFPQGELDTYMNNQKQKFRVDNEKVMSVARRKFGELIFGPSHPYGYFLKEEDFERVTKKMLVDFYAGFYRSQNCNIILAGKVQDSHLQSLNRYFGGNDWSGQAGKMDKEIKTEPSTQKQHLVYREDAIQSAIRIGRPLFDKKHPDYLPFQVLNCVYGGYFGSRLMSNIREDKGYTYGIGSASASLLKGGFFFVSTEVGVDVCEKAIHEIVYEMKRLREEEVKNEELGLVKNYMLGVFQRSVDGPFALAEKFKAIMEYGLDYSFYQEYIRTIKTITPRQVQELANRYFSENDMIELVVGKRNSTEA